MAQYIEKTRATVRISLGEKETLEGSIALAPRARYHDGPETILELLNSPVRVIPFARGKGDSVLLVTRLNIVWVAAAAGLDAPLVCPATYCVTREERVQVVFTDGSRVEGLIQMELPEHVNRASDFLNAAEDFFPLVTGSGTLLVNKLCVREIRVFETSPMPLVPGAERG
jgi:hypothetical protein